MTFDRIQVPLKLSVSADVRPLSPFGLQIHFDDASHLTFADLPVDELQPLVLQHRLILLRGLEATANMTAFAEECARWGELLEWDFGAVFEVVEHADPKNYLFTSGSVPYHWDGAFAAQVPWLQIFQCREAADEATGGETIFCDTPAVWSSLSADEQQLWRSVEIEYKTEKVAHYGGSIRAPLVQTHPLTGETTLRFAEPANENTVSLNTPNLEVHGIERGSVPEFLADLTRRVYDRRFVYSHAWQPGDYLIADNHALLHGRNSYGRQLPRRLWRVHVLAQREDPS